MDSMEDESAKTKLLWWTTILSMEEWQIKELLRLKEQVLSNTEFHWANGIAEADCSGTTLDILIKHNEAMAGIHELLARQGKAVLELMRNSQNDNLRLNVPEYELIEENADDLEELVDMLHAEWLKHNQGG
jgi:hypothetical protein